MAAETHWIEKGDKWLVVFGYFDIDWPDGELTSVERAWWGCGLLLQPLYC